MTGRDAWIQYARDVDMTSYMGDWSDRQVADWGWHIVRRWYALDSGWDGEGRIPAMPDDLTILTWAIANIATNPDIETADGQEMLKYVVQYRAEDGRDIWDSVNVIEQGMSMVVTAGHGRYYVDGQEWTKDEIIDYAEEVWGCMFMEARINEYLHEHMPEHEGDEVVLDIAYDMYLNKAGPELVMQYVQDYLVPVG